MSLVRGLFRYLDQMSLDQKFESLSSRYHLEEALVRQFYETQGELVRLSLSVPFAVTDSKPLPAFASPEEVERTRGIDLPDMSVMGPLAHLWPRNVYR